MKVALVHDWLTGMRGGERCLMAFIDLYPQADIYTLLHVPGSTDPEIDRRVVSTSFLQKFPAVRKYYRLLLPLFPRAIRGFDFSDYDLVISLSHAAAKNIEVPDGVPHFSFCFTPMRYVWDQARAYFGALTPLLAPITWWLRRWDVRGSNSVTEFVAISKFVASRIRRFYKRDSTVIYPPVDANWIEPISGEQKGEAFLYAGALVPYKRVDAIVEAFNVLGEELWIVGGGPEEQRLKSMAKDNIRFFGRVSDAELASYYRRCRSLVFAAKEDFGLIPVECMAAGRPVIAPYEGALRESLRGVTPWDITNGFEPEVATGVFIAPGADSLALGITEAVKHFISFEDLFKVRSCLEQAERFSLERFRTEWQSFVQEKLGLSGDQLESDESRKVSAC